MKFAVMSLIACALSGSVLHADGGPARSEQVPVVPQSEFSEPRMLPVNGPPGNDHSRLVQIIVPPKTTPERAEEWHQYLDTLRSLSTGERYLLGVSLTTIPKGLHKRLGLKDESGLLVSNVDPDRPAAKAGVKQYDLLLKVNDKAVSDAGQVLQEVSAGKGKAVELLLLRDEDPFTVTVTPEKAEVGALPDPDAYNAPQGMQFIGPGMLLPGQSNEEIDALKKQIESLQKQQAEMLKRLDALSEKIESK